MTSTATSRQSVPKLPPRSPESFESLSRRNAAAEILQSYEKLSWWSFQRCETIAQTRMHFQNVVAGFTADDEASLVDWKEDVSPRPLKPGEQPKRSRKGKERTSTGGPGEIAPTSGSPQSGSSKAKQTDGKKRKSAGGDVDGA